jgi:hypothetical protein
VLPVIAHARRSKERYFAVNNFIFISLKGLKTAT